MEFLEMLGNVSVISIILFVVGLVLIIIELYEPGFGIFGSMGVVCLAACVLLTAQTVMQGIMLTAIFIIIVIALLILFLALISKRRIPKKLILQESTSAELGFSGTEDRQYLLGKTGTVVSICRPVGNVVFDGVKHDVVSRGEFIDKGTEIEVVEVEGARIVVKAK